MTGPSDGAGAAIDLQATAFAGLVVITTAIGAFPRRIANGEDPSPYARLGAVRGLAYVVGVAFMRRRSSYFA